MRMDPTRKCSSLADVEKFGVFGHSNFKNTPIFENIPTFDTTID
jgi:hypothetical protein